METVAQGATYSDLTAPILDASGAPVTDGAGDITVVLLDANDDDQSSGITIAHSSGGRYRITKTLSGSAVTGAWGGTVVYDDEAGLVRRQTIDFTVVTAAQADPAGALSGATIETGSPVAVTGEVDIYRGDAYATADSRELPWEITGSLALTLPDLTGATITLYATHLENKRASFTASGSVVTPTGATREVLVQLTSAQTDDLLDGDYAYSVVAVPTSGRPLTLAADTLTVHPGGKPPKRG
jgi:hypothetical protein